MSYFSIFLFICITLWSSRENFWREKKIGPPPLGFWSSPTYAHNQILKFGNPFMATAFSWKSIRGTVKLHTWIRSSSLKHNACFELLWVHQPTAAYTTKWMIGIGTRNDRLFFSEDTILRLLCNTIVTTNNFTPKTTRFQLRHIAPVIILNYKGHDLNREACSFWKYNLNVCFGSQQYIFHSKIV